MNAIFSFVWAVVVDLLGALLLCAILAGVFLFGWNYGVVSAFPMLKSLGFLQALAFNVALYSIGCVCRGTMHQRSS